MTFQERINVILGLPKSMVLNIRIFGFKRGIKLPILVSHGTKVKNIHSDCLVINSKPGFGQIKIGINLGPFDRGKGKGCYVNFGKGQVVFAGKANIAAGSVINVVSGKCKFGDNFSANNDFICSCGEEIIFGNNVLLGWNCTVIDSDGHFIYNNADKSVINPYRRVIIGNNCWLAANTTILKGAELSDYSVVGTNSTVSGRFSESNVIVCGTPAKIIKRDISWER